MYQLRSHVHGVHRLYAYNNNNDNDNKCARIYCCIFKTCILCYSNNSRDLEINTNVKKQNIMSWLNVPLRYTIFFSGLIICIPLRFLLRNTDDIIGILIALLVIRAETCITYYVRIVRKLQIKYACYFKIQYGLCAS